MSPDGNHLLAATTCGLRLYHLHGADGGLAALPEGASSSPLLSVERLKLEPDPGEGEQQVGCSTAVALADTHAVVADSEGVIRCYELGSSTGGGGEARARLCSQHGAPGAAGGPERAQPGDREGLVGGQAGAGTGGKADGSSSSGGKQKQLGARGLAVAASAGGEAYWRPHLPHVAEMAASPDGRWLAVAGRGGVGLYTLPQLQPHGKVLRPLKDAPVTGLVFSSDSKLLGASLACSSVLVVEVEACRPLPWCLEHETAVAACLERLPGAPCGLSLSPATASSVSGAAADGGCWQVQARGGPRLEGGQTVGKRGGGERGKGGEGERGEGGERRR